jgi:hypothetical protein
MVMAGTGSPVPVLTGAGRWGLLALGVYLFVVSYRGVRPMVAGRIMIGIWMLMFAGVRLSMTRIEREI